MRLLLFLLAASSAFAAPLQVEVSARSAILMNAETGAILYEKEAHLPSFPASITKVATALYVLEKKQSALDEMATATHDAVMAIPSHLRQGNFDKHPPYRLEVGGTHIGIRTGENLSLHVLLYGLMLSSANDAANVIAHHASGSIEQFVAELNQFLKDKGVRETTFVNPSGLHHPEHKTTAYDMALITRQALKIPLFREVVKTVRYVRPPTNKQPQNYFVQGNKLLKSGQYYYPKAIGVKTGYTQKAGYTFVGAAEHDGRTLIVALLGCSDMNGRYKDAIKLFEAAFAEKRQTRMLFRQEFDRFFLTLKGGKAPLEACLSKDLKISYYPAEEVELKAAVRWKPLQLPILQGQEVAALELVDALGQVYQTHPLYAARAVDKTAMKSLIDTCVRHRKLLIAFFLGCNVAAVLLYFLKKQKKVV